jgi:hypothetical protein
MKIFGQFLEEAFSETRIQDPAWIGPVEAVRRPMRRNHGAG